LAVFIRLLGFFDSHNKFFSSFSVPNQIQKKMKSNLKLSAILMCLVLAGCMETGHQLTESESSKIPLASDEYNPNARKGDGGGGTTGQIYLSVTVDDLMISSDGRGVYINGIDGVSAQFLSSDGTLSFITNTTNSNSFIRKLIFPENGYLINPNLSSSYELHVLAPLNVRRFKRIQDFVVGESQIMGMRIWGSYSSVIEFRLLFNIGSNVSVTDEVKVTRTAIGTWTVESTVNATAALTGGNNKDFQGNYSVPFKLTLNKIN
jgi:hypothetical protein